MCRNPEGNKKNNANLWGRPITDNIDTQEEAWNFGASGQFKIPVGEKILNLDVEYYYTDFVKQVVCDMDNDAHKVQFYNLDGDSYSHVIQAEATYELLPRLNLTAAYRHTISKTTYKNLGTLENTKKFEVILTYAKKNKSAHGLPRQYLSLSYGKIHF